MKGVLSTATRGRVGGGQKITRIMKKTYKTPAVAVVDLDPAGLMAISMNVSDDVVDTNEPGVQLGREYNGWGDNTSVWDQGW